jgi:large subunit ribosomal protein L10
MGSRFKKQTGHDKKATNVKKLSDKIKNSKTLIVVSIKGLPSRQFQDIKKTLRNEADIYVAKKNIMLRVINSLGDSAKDLEKDIKENSAFLISNSEGFELAGKILSKRSAVFAKAGQIAPMDIEVKDGPTELPPGPAISELGALGLVVSVESGKIAIKKSRVVVREGDAIKENVASVLQKLGIQPFSVGLEPVAIYDVKEAKVYTNIKINSEETINELKLSFGRSLGFAQKIGYFCRETIGYFLAKRNMEANAINNKIGGSN